MRIVAAVVVKVIANQLVCVQFGIIVVGLRAHVVAFDIVFWFNVFLGGDALQIVYILV
jgi:hypothetical protein